MNDKKFSQLNKDYAKNQAWKKAPTKPSKDRPRHRYVLGFLIFLILSISGFYLKKPFFDQIASKIKPPTHKVTPTHPSKKPKHSSSSHEAYGFYTLLPNAQIKSPPPEEVNEK